MKDLTHTRARTLPTGAAERKNYPVATGVLDYFPDAIVALAELSKKGNDQHNPGQPLHWAREKSTDQDDTLIRHFLERGKLDSDGMRHSVKMAWRALALVQLEIEAERASVSSEPPPRRAMWGEEGCGAKGAHWFCERVNGHTGNHMAWTGWPGATTLRENGEWS